MRKLLGVLRWVPPGSGPPQSCTLNCRALTPYHKTGAPCGSQKVCPWTSRRAPSDSSLLSFKKYVGIFHHVPGSVLEKRQEERQSLCHRAALLGHGRQATKE